MAAVIVFAVVSLMVAIGGCIVIWGYDARRAERIPFEVRRPQAAQRQLPPAA